MRFDLHCHSKYSKDGTLSTSHIAKIARQKKIGIALTDHNTATGWKSFSKDCKQQKIPFILGQEQKVFFNSKFAGELLFYFLNQEIKSHDLFEAIEEARTQDAFISVAHPFEANRKIHFGKFFCLEKIAKKIDAIETYNSRCLWNYPNKLANNFTEKFFLGKTAGSDAHFAEEISNSTVEAETESLEEFRKMLKKGNCKIQGKISPFFVHAKTQLAKYGFLKKETD